VLILGGGMVGVEVAEFLAKRGKQVVVVEILEEVARDMDPISRKLLLKRLEALPTELHTTTELMRIDDGRVFINYRGDQRELGRFDTVVVTAGNRPFNPLSEQLVGVEFAVKVVGDADKPGTIYDAVGSGHKAGMTV
jgi:NADPH-dependent 2,4-dienoyl-CoA reductase/sulfur reductase-like enzyme